MKITRDNVGNLPLDEFLTAVSGIYSEQDEKRSIYDVWLHATHHAASIGEEVRKFKPGEELFKEIADFRDVVIYICEQDQCATRHRLESSWNSGIDNPCS